MAGPSSASYLPSVASSRRFRVYHFSGCNDGLDVFSVSRRIGHGSAALTLWTYAHRFTKKEAKAAEAIEAALTQ